MLFILQAKTDRCPVECATLYLVLHTRKNGSVANEVVQAKMVSNPFYYIQFYYMHAFEFVYGSLW